MATTIFDPVNRCKDSTQNTIRYGGLGKEEEEVGSKINGDDAKRVSNQKTFPTKQSRGNNAIKVKPSIPRRREDVMKWYGWGYKDSGYELQDGIFTLYGPRYLQYGAKFPVFMEFLQDKLKFAAVTDIKDTASNFPKDEDFPESRIKRDHVDMIKALGVDVSVEGSDRFIRSHDQSLRAVLKIKAKMINRIPDAVVWPTCHEDAVEIVRLATEHNIVLIPYGGGTSVTGASDCPEKEPRPIIVVDTSQMNEILWIDHESLMVCAESGITGQDLENELNKLGYTTGHEPDSKEFSTLGGWISTRASGVKKNIYGNIDELFVHARMVTPIGVLEKRSKAPRTSSGPDFNHWILGSEGSFGVITEVCLKIRPRALLKVYGSVLFPDFATGSRWIREITAKRLRAANIKLIDEEQFQMGKAFREGMSKVRQTIEDLLIGYMVYAKGFSHDKMCMATIIYEGDKDTIAEQQKKINAMAVKHGGMPSSGNHGERGYIIPSMVGYIRDIAIELNILMESFETCIPWDQVAALTRKIRARALKEGHHVGAAKTLTMFGIAQTYDTGCLLYTYLMVPVPPNWNMLKLIDYLHHQIRDEIVSFGASVSHHHGVGKTRKDWYETSVSSIGHDLLQSAKMNLDPKNIFAVNNLVQEWRSPGSKL